MTIRSAIDMRIQALGVTSARLAWRQTHRIGVRKYRAADGFCRNGSRGIAPTSQAGGSVTRPGVLIFALKQKAKKLKT